MHCHAWGNQTRGPRPPHTPPDFWPSPGAQTGQVLLREKEVTAEVLKNAVGQMNTVLAWYCAADEVFENKKVSRYIRASPSEARYCPSSCRWHCTVVSSSFILPWSRLLLLLLGVLLTLVLPPPDTASLRHPQPTQVKRKILELTM